jgi:hypothetical protein
MFTTSYIDKKRAAALAKAIAKANKPKPDLVGTRFLRTLGGSVKNRRQFASQYAAARGDHSINGAAYYALYRAVDHGQIVWHEDGSFSIAKSLPTQPETPAEEPRNVAPCDIARPETAPEPQPEVPAEEVGR